MKQEFEKMTIKGQKSAILLVRALLNHPQQLDYIRDTYLVKRHGSWQFKDKLSVMLDKGDGNMTRHEANYLLKQDKMISNNNKKDIIQAILVTSGTIAAGILIAVVMLRIGGVI
jgi:hypothetical protein